jgi:two-component system chemotaxis sensor kinase CheA
MALDDAAFEALCETLRNEAFEQVERIGTALLLIERGAEGAAREQLLEEAFRQAHNLKGAASSLGFGHTARLAHAVESVLASLRTIDPDRSPEVFDTLNAGLSTVHHALRIDPSSEHDPVVSEAIEALEEILVKPAGMKPLPAPPLSPVVRPADGVTVATRSRSPRSLGYAPPPPEVTPPPSRSRTYAEPQTKSSEPPPQLHREPAPPAVAATGPSPGMGPAAAFSTSGNAGTSGGSSGTAAGTHVLGGGDRGASPTGQIAKIPGTAAAPAPAPRLSGTEETLRVSMKKLSALMAQVGELLAARVRTDQRLTELRAVLAAEEERLKAQTMIRAMVRDEAPAKLEGWAERLVDVQHEDLEHERLLVRRMREIVRAFESDALQSTILSGQLQEDIRRIQTFPLASVLEPLPRAVRNMAREAGKMVDLVITGAELELDKKVLEELRDPLYHLLRNAMDHGCEQPTVRAAMGKPARGTIRIRAEHRGDVVTITVSDDGPGVDIAAVRRAAINTGLVSTLEAAEMPEHRVLELLFAPGLTTRAEAGELSGRGVGLDAVRTNIERLHGTVTVESRQGVGTSFVIVLPLTIYVVHSLLLGVGEDQFAMPISSIQRILRISAAEVLEVERTHAIIVDGRPIALVPLASLLGLPVELPPPPERIPVLVIGIGETRCALAVREIVSDQTVLAKNLEPPLVRVRNIAGATILGDGRVVLMLNPIDLLRSASGRDADRFRALLPRVENRPKLRLLLVDDSFTTRALERSVLEVAGFDVVAVADGHEALGALELESFDIVVSDVSMPGMTGLELCETIRQNDRLRRLPVVLVTSLGSEEDRMRGMSVGADAYIVKSEFDHEVFVKTVNELVGRA